ncbi:Mur ligase family protein [Paenibacillus sp. FSL R10-2734]|uniref:bifunctional folylpolyglutamate synthase/dihydrofolate synthase n=1 Tax=Paenibacillus sp. FSL R10-2734 TaxID=2954691 RepID=UPI0030D6E592
MEFTSQSQVEDMIYSSYLRAINNITETLDEQVRRPDLTRKLLDLVGSPDHRQKYILVTGSKGKGSTSRFISSLLSHLGYKVGLFTSPHLVDFNERIRIDGQAISTDDFVRLGNVVREGFQKIEDQLAADEYQGPVGVGLAIATLYFKENHTDFNVIECGRGGRFDDTNVLKNDWAVITPIMEEHIANLGPDLNSITLHKLGIVKNKATKAFISKQKSSVLAAIKANLNSNSVQYYEEQFWADSITITSIGTTFDVRTNQAIYPSLTIPLLGQFQALNAATAVALCEDITGGHLNRELVVNCFEKLQWPGRCEVICHDPLTIIDGAIHKESASYLAELIQLVNPDNSRTVTSIIGVPKDKDYTGVIEVMSMVSYQLIVTRPDISHLSFPTDALSIAKRFIEKSFEFPYLEDALTHIKARSASGIIVIVGTQTFIGNAKRLFGQSLLDIGL